MNPLPLLLESLLVKIFPMKGNLWFPTFFFFLLVAINSFSQRSYFEYNNPDAVKINKKVLDQLTDVEWNLKDVSWLIRKDTFNYARGGSLKLTKTGTYLLGIKAMGTWQLKYNRYLIIEDTSNYPNSHKITGTFGVTSLDDSTLVLTQLHSSSRDMSRTLTFVKGRVLRDTEKYPTYDRYGNLYSVKPARRQRNLLAPALIDSLTFLSKEVLLLLGHREVNDTLYINGPDSLYKVRLHRDNPLKRVKILHEGLEIEDYAAYRRFTLSSDQVPLVDSLALNYIRKHRDDYYPQKEITSFNSYFRQYVGYFDINGDPIVLVNAFCQYKNNWDDSLVQVGLGGVCYFNISINLTKKEAFSFHVNDF
jgi:hypothetical protein